MLMMSYRLDHLQIAEEGLFRGGECHTIADEFGGDDHVRTV